MAKLRKKWQLRYQGTRVTDDFTSEKAAYEFIGVLARTWAAEQTGRGWECFERVDLADLVPEAKGKLDEAARSAR